MLDLDGPALIVIVQRRKFSMCDRDMGHLTMSKVKFEQVQQQALELSASERAKLAAELIESLDALPEAEVNALWLEECERRAAQIDRGEVALVPAEVVAQRVRSLIK
jgi:putative addiction module component (TIGR02574 family)